MIRRRVVWQMSLTVFREFVRTPGAVFWTYGFPLLIAVLLGIAFSGRKPAAVQVLVEDAPGAAALVRELASNPRLGVRVEQAAAADRALAMGNADVVVRPLGEPELRLDPTRPEAELALLLVRQAFAAREHDGAAAPPLHVVEVTRPGTRYIDWVIPGLVGITLLGAGLWGVGLNLVYMRMKNLLRRLVVTPMGRAEFLLAFLASRLCLAMLASVVVVLFGRLCFGVPVRGSWLAVLLICLLGSLALSGLGLLVSSRARTMESVSGLMNLVQLPMWLLGGSFFSNERFPAALQPVVQALPLTHFNKALREIMLSGAAVGQVWTEIAALAAFACVFFLAAVKLFRWT